MLTTIEVFELIVENTDPNKGLLVTREQHEKFLEYIGAREEPQETPWKQSLTLAPDATADAAADVEDKTPGDLFEELLAHYKKVFTMPLGECFKYNFLTWNYDDLRFRQWQPARSNPLDLLAKSELTIENYTDSNKKKSSGRHHSREENEDEDKREEKKSMSQEATAGGGFTSVNMDE